MLLHENDDMLFHEEYSNCFRESHSIVTAFISVFSLCIFESNWKFKSTKANSWTTTITSTTTAMAMATATANHYTNTVNIINRPFHAAIYIRSSGLMKVKPFEKHISIHIDRNYTHHLMTADCWIHFPPVCPFLIKSFIVCVWKSIHWLYLKIHFHSIHMNHFQCNISLVLKSMIFTLNTSRLVLLYIRSSLKFLRLFSY